MCMSMKFNAEKYIMVKENKIGKKVFNLRLLLKCILVLVDDKTSPSESVFVNLRLENVSAI